MSAIQQYLESLYEKYKNLDDGNVASYIPELALANKNWFGISIATVDGAIYEVGDVDKEFTIQSISKVLTYAMALEDRGVDYVLSKVGVEASGDAFNAISLDSNNKPRNPMINIGAIATTSLIKADYLIDKILNKFSDFAGRKLSINESVYISESKTGHRNRAIGYMLRNFDVIEKEPTPVLEAYFQQCAISLNCKDLAVIGATIANNGINPITKQKVVDSQYIKCILSVMSIAGMYDYAGRWIYQIGLPAKSGVGGGILTILPGQLAIATFSPPLDRFGNSVRGIKVLEDISQDLNIHIFNIDKFSKSFIRSKLNLSNTTSHKERNKKEAEVLRHFGDEVTILSLQGNLNFYNCEILIREMLNLKTHYIIVDLNRVYETDLSSAKLIHTTLVNFVAQNREIIFADEGNNHILSEYLESQNVHIESIFFETLDKAIEYFEEKIIDHRLAHRDISIPLEEFAICQDLNEEELECLKSITKERTFTAKEIVIEKNSRADSLFFLLEGNVDVFLNPDFKNRLSSIQFGNLIGEMSILDNSPRSAFVVANKNIKTLELTLDEYTNLSTKMPSLKNKLITNIAKELSMKLKKANSQISSMA